jgi:hypothetical protein
MTVLTRTACVAITVLCMAAAALAGDLKFRAAGEGVFTFDTGQVRGRLEAKPQSQGVISLVDARTGKELTHGFKDYGFFSLYRLLYTGGRWGPACWEMPKEGTLLDDGAVQITWPAQDDHPVELTAVYRWSSPNTLDLEVSAKPGKDASKFELFLASYFSEASRAEVYVKPGLHGGGKAGFMLADATPMTVGTYLAFPRDRSAAQMFYDTRWDREPHPVQWSVTRYMAGPLVAQRDRAAGTTAVVMARPEDCFAVDLSYNMEPPDGVAGHHSTYFSLFGRDVKAGETRRARLRLLVGHEIKPEEIIEAYRSFSQGT